MILENNTTKVDDENSDTLPENDWESEILLVDEITDDMKSCAINIIPDQGNYIKHKTLL